MNFIRPADALMVGKLVGTNKKRARRRVFALYLAEWTGLEPATPGVTGRYSNQLNYHSARVATLRGFEPRYSP
jgi:hypothetical protein